MKDWADSVERIIESIKDGAWIDALEHLQALKTVFNSFANDTYGFGKDLLDKDYQETVSGIADEIARQWRAGEFKGSRDSVQQSVEERCDAATTYTQKAQFVLALSRNDNAYLEEMGEMPSANNGSFPWEALATMALRKDVWSQLRYARGVDVDEDPPDEPLTDCTSCGDWKVGKDGTCDECRAEGSD